MKFDTVNASELNNWFVMMYGNFSQPFLTKQFLAQKSGLEVAHGNTSFLDGFLRRDIKKIVMAYNM